MPPPYMCVFKQCFFYELEETMSSSACYLPLSDVWRGSCAVGKSPAEPWAPLLLIAPPGHGLNVENCCWLFKGLQSFGWTQRTESAQLGTQISWLHFKYLNLSRLGKAKWWRNGRLRQSDTAAANQRWNKKSKIEVRQVAAERAKGVLVNLKKLAKRKKKKKKRNRSSISERISTP